MRERVRKRQTERQNDGGSERDRETKAERYGMKETERGER